MTLTDNILSVYYRSNELDKVQGKSWYETAHNVCKGLSTNYGLSLDTVTGVVSALSPNNKWDRNLIDAENMIRAYCYDIAYPKVCTFHTQKDKAIMILENNYDNPKNIMGVLKGNKTIAFYRGITTQGHCDEITVDGHAFNIWRGEYTPLNQVPAISNKLYQHVTDSYKAATDVLNDTLDDPFNTMGASQVQAITWVTWRRIHNVV